MCEVKLTNLTFSYDEHIVLKDISVVIQSGDFVAIVGPNGAGKSTLLKAIAGLIKPVRGEVIVNGQPILKKQKGLVAYVPQNYGKNLIGFPATVREIVTLGLVASAQEKQYTAQAIQHIVGHLLDLVGMADTAERRIDGLSGGQQQRVMVAMALSSNPKLLLLDEPTSGIDYEASSRIYELLATLNKNLGITVVMVSHDIDKAIHSAQKVMCINQGVCFYGDSQAFTATHAQERHLWYYGK